MWFSKFKQKIVWNQKQVDFDKLPNIYKKRSEILKLVRKHSTPLFVADRQILLNRLQSSKKALQKHWGNYKIAYSFKTNYEIAKLNIFRKHGLWAEVVSGREYQMAKKLGYKGNEIIFNGPYKKDTDLSLALDEGALVNIDNFDEVERVIKIAKKLSSQREVGIRINSEIPYVASSRFGFSIDTNVAALAVEKINESKNLKLTNFHIHLGTDIDKVISYQIASRKMCNFIKENIDDYQNTIKSLDFGGGFPAHGLASFGRIKWNPKPIENYVQAISSELNKVYKDNKPTLILEPGRYLVDDAVFFITKITNSQKRNSSQILTTDATVTMLPLIYYRPQIVKLFDRKLTEKKVDYLNSIIYGASCREDDILYNNRLPKAEIGDFLIYYITGAYNQNMSGEFIFKKPNLYTI